MNSSYSSTLSYRLWLGKELTKFCPPNSSDDLCLFFCLYPSYLNGAVVLVDLDAQLAASGEVVWLRDVTLHNSHYPSQQRVFCTGPLILFQKSELDNCRDMVTMFSGPNNVFLYAFWLCSLWLLNLDTEACCRVVVVVKRKNCHVPSSADKCGL